ncbi:MAG: hypothetical protein Fur0015_09380 [Ignavibacteriales bacterium]
MKIKSLIALILFSLSISGCLNYTQVTTLKTDGSGEMFIHYWMKVDFDNDTSVVNKLGIFSADSIRKEFTSKYSTIKNIEVYNDYSDSTIHGKVEITFPSIDSLNLTEPFKDSHFSYKDGEEETKVFKQVAHSFVTGFGFENQKLSVKYIYYIPGKILTHNANLKENNKLTWEYNSGESNRDKNVEVTFVPYKLKETPVIIYYMAGLMIITVVFFLLRKKK